MTKPPKLNSDFLMNVHILHNMRKVHPKVRSRNSPACFRCGGGNFTPKTTSPDPPLPGPKTKRTCYRAPEATPDATGLLPLPPLVRSAKERGQNSIRSTCCARLKFQKITTGRHDDFCSEQRPIERRTQTKNTTINQIFLSIYLLAA